jgi:DNA polymerase I
MNKNFDSKNTVYLIDGSSYLYRAYFGMRPLHTSSGEPVQAVYSFIRMIGKLAKQFSPEQMVLVWDSKGRTERKEIFEDYKAGRQEPPMDLFQQKEHIVKFADLIGLEQLARVGVEADDIIGSLAKDFSAQGKDVVIITSDKDLFQLLTDKVFVYDSFKDEAFDAAAFEEKRGFVVGRLPFYHALLGDSSDNIPGVKGVGKKSAEELVKQFGSLEELYNNLDKVEKPRNQKALEANKDNAFLSLDLFLLRYHKFDLGIEDVKFSDKNWDNAQPLFEELEFKAMLSGSAKAKKDANEPVVPFFEKKGYDFKCITKVEELQSLCAELKRVGSFALDTETTGVNPFEDKMIGMSICYEKGKAYYIPFGHKVEGEQLTLEEVSKEIKPILEDANIKKYLHNVKFDKLVFHVAGIDLQGLELDTMVAAGIAVKDWQRIGLKHLSEYYFDEQMLSFDDVVKKNKLKDLSYASLDLATGYAASDAHQTLALAERLKNELSSKELELYRRMEGPLLDVIYDMEFEGVSVDLNILKNIDVKVSAELKMIEAEIRTLIGSDEESENKLNLNSPKQVEDLLFNQLNLPPQKKSGKRTGYSTDSSVLEVLAQMHPVPGLILKYRELYKLKTTYIDALPNYVCSVTGKIHTTYSQVKTATGRLSSRSPNLQNVPLSSFGIRSAFKPDEGKVFIAADYSQIELRILGYLSQDPTLLAAFENNKDIHAITAAKLFNVPTEEVTTAQRQVGKRINFSIMYGLTPFGLAKDLKIPFKDARLYIDKFFEQYPKVSEWMAKTVDKAKETGYVETLWNRRRYVPEIHEKNKTKFELAKRLVVNTPVQGTAADIMKIAMINLHKKLKAEGLYKDSKIILQIHDELLLSVKKEDVEKISSIVKSVLESVVFWNIPLTVSVKAGNNWQEVSK